MKELLTIQAELKSPKNQYNGFGKYNYRSCEDILEAVKPLLAREGVVMTISDSLVNMGDRFYIKATVTLRKGEERIEVSALAREDYQRKGMSDSQITGTASSYARKYALSGMYLIDDTKDADHMDNSQLNQFRPITAEQEKALQEYADQALLDGTPEGIKKGEFIVKRLKDNMSDVQATALINRCRGTES